MWVSWIRCSFFRSDRLFTEALRERIDFIQVVRPE